MASKQDSDGSRSPTIQEDGSAYSGSVDGSEFTSATETASATVTEGAAPATIIVDSDEGHESVLSYNKTPLPQPRDNPALLLQKITRMNTMENSQPPESLETTVAMARKFSTDKCDTYHESTSKVKVLIEQLSHMVRESMPAHASEMITEQQSSPQVLLIHGIINTGDGDYQLSIDRFKQALMMCDAQRKKSPRGVDDMGTKEIRINCLNQIGIALCLMNNFDEAERYFQLALEEYCKDENLISHIVDRYSELATNAGPNFVDNSPIHQFIEATTAGINSEMPKEDAAGPPTPAGPGTETPNKTEEAAGAAAQAEGGADKGSTSDPFGKLSWFPATKEELLDYSAAYIQMMIMGAEMVKHQQNPKPTSASAPNEYGEMAV